MSYNRKIGDKKRLIKLSKEACRAVKHDEKTEKYIRLSLSKMIGFPKKKRKLCNKKIRRYSGTLKRCNYKRIRKCRQKSNNFLD